jgi:hypothetical protein
MYYKNDSIAKARAFAAAPGQAIKAHGQARQR